MCRWGGGASVCTAWSRKCRNTVLYSRKLWQELILVRQFSGGIGENVIFTELAKLKKNCQVLYTVLLTLSQSTYNYSTMDYTQGLNLPLRTGDCGVNNSPRGSIAHPSTVLPHDPGINPLLDHHHSKLGPNGKQDALYHTTVTMHPQLYTVAAKKGDVFVPFRPIQTALHHSC